MPVGMYLSRCRGALDDVLDLPALVERFSGSVAVCRIVDDFFAVEVKGMILDDVARHGLGGVVLAGNSPDHYRRSLSAPELRSGIVAAGVNPNRIAFANILEQVALAHADDADGAQAKAVAVLHEALDHASSFPPIAVTGTVPDHSVLVLGATVGGLVAAQHLLRLGYDVHLADMVSADDPTTIDGGLSATVAYVSSHPRATIHRGASLVDADGWIGDYGVVLDTAEGTRRLTVGGIVIADSERWIEPLRRHYALAVNDDGMPRPVGPAHPARTSDPGIAVLPAHDPGDLTSIVEAVDSAVLSLIIDLSVPKTSRYTATSSVDETLCGGCASCVKTCAFGACTIDEETGISHVDPRRCHGCGKCVVSCPVGARDLVSSPHSHMLDTIGSMSTAEVAAPRVLGFLCSGCGYPAADEAGRLAAAGGDTYPSSFLPIRIPCGGRLDALYVLEAFRRGFDAVAVFRCREGHCQNLVGNLDMDRRINLLRSVLRSRSIDDARLRIIDISPEEGALFTEEVNAFFGELPEATTAEGGER